LTATFDDPLDMGVALRRGVEVEYFSHAAADYRARLTIADLDGHEVHEVEDGAHSARARNGEDRAILIFGWADLSPDIRLNACSLTEADALLVLPGGDVRAIVPCAPHWLMLNLPAAALADPLARLPPAARAARFAPLRGLLHAAPGLRRIAREATSLAMADPGCLLHPGPVAAMKEAMVAQFDSGITGLQGQDHDLMALRGRVRLVTRAEAFLDSVISRPVYTEEVSAALGVGPRALNEAFNAVYGTTLHRALRIRRLNLARQRLRAPGAGADLVKTIALDLGFWHLGRFAIAYRDLFRETPSETLAQRP
jgi:AraC-like DNA-binding protein